MKSTYYITTIQFIMQMMLSGHVYTMLACDVIARFKRLDEYEVFSTGTMNMDKKLDKKIMVSTRVCNTELKILGIYLIA